MPEKTTLIRRDSAVLSGDLVKVPIGILSGDNVPVGARLMSFDPSGPGGAAILMATEGASDKMPEQFIDRPFNLVNWVAKAIDLPDMATSQIVRVIRITLVDDKNQCVAFSSKGVAESLDLLRMLSGDGPYSPPIPVWVVFVKTRGGKRLTRLSVLPPAKDE